MYHCVQRKDLDCSIPSTILLLTSGGNSSGHAIAYSYLLSISTLTFHFISSSILTIGISLKSLISLLKDFVNIRALSVSIEFGPMYKGICINQYATGLIIYSFDMWFLNSSDIELLHASKMRSSQQTWYFSLKFV